LKVVITGLDGVIHVIWRADPVGAEGVDGRITSGHDDWWGGHVVANKSETTIMVRS
jgi:hypothetical protein